MGPSAMYVLNNLRCKIVAMTNRFAQWSERLLQNNASLQQRRVVDLIRRNRTLPNSSRDETLEQLIAEWNNLVSKIKVREPINVRDKQQQEKVVANVIKQRGRKADQTEYLRWLSRNNAPLFLQDRIDQTERVRSQIHNHLVLTNDNEDRQIEEEYLQSLLPVGDSQLHAFERFEATSSNFAENGLNDIIESTILPELWRLEPHQFDHVKGDVVKSSGGYYDRLLYAIQTHFSVNTSNLWRDTRKKKDRLPTKLLTDATRELVALCTDELDLLASMVHVQPFLVLLDTFALLDVLIVPLVMQLLTNGSKSIDRPDLLERLFGQYVNLCFDQKLLGLLSFLGGDDRADTQHGYTCWNAITLRP